MSQENMFKGETRKWECENGSVYGMPYNHCVFCNHCTDIYYDSDGPYMFSCNINKEIELAETECKCAFFEDDGYVFNEKEYLQKKIQQEEALRNLLKNLYKNRE